MKTVEYRLRPVTRYIVTRYHDECDENGRGCCGVETLGPFENEQQAQRVVNALRAADPDCSEPQEPVAA